MKKFFAILLALAMTFALSATALAAQEIGDGTENPGTITINNAVIGNPYKVYKVFDATYDEGDSDIVAYTYTKTGDTDALYTALTGEDSPFTLTLTTTTNVYNVTIKEGKDGAAVAAWLKSKESLLGDPTAQTPEGGATENVINFHVPYGYYYITTDPGAAVTVDTVAPSVTVYDKNEEPHFPPEGGKLVWNGTEWVTANSQSIGETAKFQINAYVPKYSEGRAVTTYTFTDTLGTGFTYTNNVKIWIRNDAPANDEGEYTWHELPSTAFTVTENPTGTIKFVFNTNITDGDWSYPTNATVKIEYTALINENATAENCTNNVEMTNDLDDKPTPPPPTETEVYGFKLFKYYQDKENHVELPGAEFSLWDNSDPKVKIPVVEIAAPEGTTAGTNEHWYRVATAEEIAQTDNNPVTNIKAGTAHIWGLAEGTYWLKEEVAPTGYNLLTELTKVEITKNNCGDDNILDATVEVLNNAGSELPTTGGIGTTIFYIVGALLMVGAAVLLIVRKKMSVME